MNTTSLILSGVVSSAFTLSAQAVVLVSFEFTGTTAAEVSPTTNSPEVSASDFSSPAFGFYTDTNNLQTDENLGLADGGDDNMDDAIIAQQYVTFTVTANPEFVLDLDNLTFDVGRGLRGAKDYAVRSSVDSFADNIVYANEAISETIVGQTIDLTDAAYDGLTSVEFRIYFDDRNNNSATASETFIDNVVLNGTVTAAVPEPGIFAILAGCFALGFVGLQRGRTGRRPMQG